mmetsp:Transcript_20900/g.68451  ORF Transcript_20900/g.68451 Transcript_20900/m.68451 type:complete len:238 (+) Transcript_20900:269-982(+)
MGAISHTWNTEGRGETQAWRGGKTERRRITGRITSGCDGSPRLVCGCLANRPWRAPCGAPPPPPPYRTPSLRARGAPPRVSPSAADARPLPWPAPLPRAASLPRRRASAAPAPRRCAAAPSLRHTRACRLRPPASRCAIRALGRAAAAPGASRAPPAEEAEAGRATSRRSLSAQRPPPPAALAPVPRPAASRAPRGSTPRARRAQPVHSKRCEETLFTHAVAHASSETSAACSQQEV